MKKGALVTGSLLLASLVVGNLSAFAETKEQTTTGDVTFAVDPDKKGGEVTVPGNGPGVKPPLHPTEPGSEHTDGPLRIEHVPGGISFGQQFITSETKNYDVKWGLGKVDKSTTEVKIPPFAQVTDERGVRGTWKLELKQEAVFTNTTDATNKLDNTRIQLHAGQTFNGLVADASTLVDGVTGLTADNPVEVPIGGTGNGIHVLATKTGKNTDSSKTSVVFASAADYDNDQTFYEAAKQATLKDTHGGIQLHVPGTDQKKDKAKYTANLIWALTDSI